MGGVSVTRFCSVNALCLVLLLLPANVLGWGADGHHATCLLAEPLLEPAAVKAVRSLLPEYANGSLARLCTWPDDIKWQRKWHWTSALHYIDTPDFLCRYNYDRDCYDEYGQKDYCASGAINNFTSQLTQFQFSTAGLLAATVDQPGNYNLTEALLFLAHIVGDIHQPLHVGFTSDAGGNTIAVHWYKRKYNLHHIWDNEFINRAKDLYYNSSLAVMTDAILHNITGNWVGEAKLWSKCSNEAIACPDKYASESISLACRWAYRNATPGSTLEDEYFLSRLPIVETRLAQGGVRLAAILNRLFVPVNSSEPISSPSAKRHKAQPQAPIHILARFRDRSIYAFSDDRFEAYVKELFFRSFLWGDPVQTQHDYLSNLPPRPASVTIFNCMGLGYHLSSKDLWPKDNDKDHFLKDRENGLE